MCQRPVLLSYATPKTGTSTRLDAFPNVETLLRATLLFVQTTGFVEEAVGGGSVVSTGGAVTVSLCQELHLVFM